MKSFYVKLLSNSSGIEYPHNKANHFKNRLPYPLRFQEPGWQVGVTAVMVPRAPPIIKIKENCKIKPPLIYS